jgi:predicted dehydrogenase
MHFSSIEMIPDLELNALCDINSKRLNESAEKFKIRGFKNYQELLALPDIDLVVICTPNGLHYKMAMDAFQAGKHVLLEKPIAIQLDEADALIKISQEKGLKFFAVKQVRYNPPVRILRKAILDNHLGKIFSASLVIRWTRPQEYYSESDWRGTSKMDGGTLLNQGIHYVDILQWILGDVATVFGKTDMVSHDIEIEDEAFGILKFKSGAYATIEFTINTYPHNLECSLTVLGEFGSVKLSGSAMNEIEFWQVKDFPKPAVPSGFPPNVYANGLYQGSCPNHIFVYQDIVKSFKEKSTNFIDGQEARQSLKIVKRLYESAQLEKEIKLN